MGAKYATASIEQLKPDPIFSSKLVTKFINCMMKKGKKPTAQRIFYRAMDIVKDKSKNDNTIEVFETAVNNVKPNIEVRSKRVGGANYQVPMPINKKRQQSLAIRWILQAARERTGKAMEIRLAEELLAAFNREGAAMTRRENEHRMADANKAFAHFAW